MERPFDIQIEKLKIKLIKMCSLVDEQVEFAIKSILENDNELADVVIGREEKVNKFDLKVERICHKLFALNQPVAMDLRLIMSALKINSNLERIGDLAVNIARDKKDIQETPEFLSRLHFNEISEITKSMIKDAIDSFINDDDDLAQKVISADSKLDDLVKSNSRTLVEIMKESPQNIDVAIIIYSILQELERLGDHATNIGGEVYFILKAQSLKHRADLEDDDSWNIE